MPVGYYLNNGEFQEEDIADSTPESKKVWVSWNDILDSEDKTSVLLEKTFRKKKNI